MFGKLFDSTFTGSMFGAGADTFAVWSYVIAHTVSSTVELNPLMIGAVMGMPPDDVTRVIGFLCSPDPKSRSQEEQGRRMIHEGGFQYRVVNHAKYRDIKNSEERREYNRDAKRRERSGVKPKVNDKPRMSSVSAHTETEADSRKQKAEVEERKRKTDTYKPPCPSCGVVGSLQRSPPRNGYPAGWWCRNVKSKTLKGDGCGENFPLMTPEIVEKLSPVARRELEKSVPAPQKTKAQITEEAIREGMRRVQERGVILRDTQ